MWRSWWANSQKAFFILLLIFSLIHLGTMLLRLQVLDKTKYTPKARTTPPIKVQFSDKGKSPFKRQIVESEDGEKRKVEGAYLSDKDRAFDKETLARKIDPFKKGAKSSAGDKGPKGSSAPAKQSDKKSQTAKSKGPPKKGMKLSDLGAHVGETDPFMAAAQEYTQKKNNGGGGGTNEGKISRDVSSTNDHVEDVPLGDMTHLNTVEYKYYGFYHRIKQRLEQFWGRSIQEKAQQLAKNGRQVASDDEHVTSLQITLNQEGEVIDISIMGTSGIKELDDAAVESFNDAGPFPNPPKGLVRNGRVTLEWGFVVNT